MIKWYAEGQERKKVALRLMVDLYSSATNPILKNFFTKYIRQLRSGTSIPYVLYTFNLELSSVLLKNKILLTKDQAERVRQLRKLSNLHYGNMY